MYHEECPSKRPIFCARHFCAIFLLNFHCPNTELHMLEYVGIISFIGDFWLEPFFCMLLLLAPQIASEHCNDYRRFIAGPTLNNSKKEVDFF